MARQDSAGFRLTSCPVSVPASLGRNGRPEADAEQENCMETGTLNASTIEDSGLLDGWLNRAELAQELALSVDTLQRWETRRIGPPCVRVGRKVLYRKDAVREWLCEQEARKTGAHRAVAGRR
jgi:hypothetical protein